jgi:hypothetical protein
MKNKYQIPITRHNLFFSEEEWELEKGFSRESIEQDLNQIVILFRVDRVLSQVDDLYNEGEKAELIFQPPVRLQVFGYLDDPENKAYNQDSGTLRYQQDGKLNFTVLIDQLEELDVEIRYGDYIGYPVSETEIRYFSVVDDGMKSYHDGQTILGYKPTFRKILCAPVEDDELLF